VTAGARPDGPLTGSVAIVTGAGRGIGRAVATSLHERGVHVALTGRSAGPLEALAAELRESGRPARALALPGDVTDPEAVAATVEAAERDLRPVGLLVNNAGMAESRDAPVWDADLDEWWRTVTTNLLGPVLYMRSVVPRMLARGAGRIINVNSRRGVVPMPGQTAYGVSKCGLAMVTESAAAGLRGTGVLVFDYSPGRVRTDLTAGLGASATSSPWTPMEVAVAGLVAIAEGRLDALAGRFLHAHDDLAALAGGAAEIVRRDGRVLGFTEAFPGDPLSPG
jgi:NAD(P)-dependent dehydrogenase (short-subunit alcohol dehydrogenase family)